MKVKLERTFSGCKHTEDSAANTIFSCIASLVLIEHLIIMVSSRNKLVIYSLDYYTNFNLLIMLSNSQA